MKYYIVLNNIYSCLQMKFNWIIIVNIGIINEKYLFSYYLSVYIAFDAATTKSCKKKKKWKLLEQIKL